MYVVLAFVALVSVVYSLALVHRSRVFAAARGWIDREHRRNGGPQYRPIPRLGGLGVLGGVVTATIMAAWIAPYPLSVEALFSIVGLAIVPCCVGLLDDLWTVSGAKKLAVLAVVGAFAYCLGIRIHALPGLGSALPPVASFCITVVWLAVVPAAFNLVDGLDGLAAGLVIVAGVTLAMVASIQGDFTATLLGLIIVGATLGFWYFNRFPARVFMGDGGSMLLGFLCAALVARLSGHADGRTGFVLVAAVGWPVLELVVSVARRVVRGRSPFHADAGHLHHVLAGAWGHAAAVRAIHASAVVAAGVAGIARFGLAAVPAALALALFALTPIVSRRARLDEVRPAVVRAAFVMTLVAVTLAAWAPGAAHWSRDDRATVALEPARDATRASPRAREMSDALPEFGGNLP